MRRLRPLPNRPPGPWRLLDLAMVMAVATVLAAAPAPSASASSRIRGIVGNDNSVAPGGN